MIICLYCSLLSALFHCPSHAYYANSNNAFLTTSSYYIFLMFRYLRSFVFHSHFYYLLWPFRKQVFCLIFVFRLFHVFFGKLLFAETSFGDLFLLSMHLHFRYLSLALSALFALTKKQLRDRRQCSISFAVQFLNCWRHNLPSD